MGHEEEPLPSHLQGPDVIIKAPADLLADSVEEIEEQYARNGRRTLQASPLEGQLDLYPGAEKFLVRTALIRAEGWSDRSKAPILNSPDKIGHVCGHLRFSDVEYMVTIALGSKLEVRAIHETSIGGKSTAQSHIDQLIKVAMLTAASSLIMVHNHPSGDAKPSREDVEMTKKAKEACICVGIPLADHIIIGTLPSGEVDAFSFYQHGIPPFSRA
jgi:DNA repair protein RadC